MGYQYICFFYQFLIVHSLTVLIVIIAKKERTLVYEELTI